MKESLSYPFFHIMASLAQMERELIVERTQAGLAAARQRGRVGGRRRRMTPGKLESARALLAGGMPPKEVAADLKKTGRLGRAACYQSPA